MKVYLTNGKVTAQAETLKDIEVLVKLKDEGGFSSTLDVPQETPKVRRVYRKRDNKKWTKEEDIRLVELVKAGLTNRQIAREMGLKTNATPSHRITNLRRRGIQVPYRKEGTLTAFRKLEVNEQQ